MNDADVLYPTLYSNGWRRRDKKRGGTINTTRGIEGASQKTLADNTWRKQNELSSGRVCKRFGFLYRCILAGLTCHTLRRRAGIDARIAWRPRRWMAAMM